MDARRVMDGTAAYVPWPALFDTGESCYATAAELCGDAIAADVGFVKRLLTELLQHPGRRADEKFQSQLDALQNLLLGLRSMALTDDLTNVCNRRGFLQAGSQLLETLRRDQHRAVVFFVDVDNLKTVNDTLGHIAGDALLMRTAQVLRSVFRKRDLIGRLGGDEFAALAPSNDPLASSLITDRLREAVAASNEADKSCVLSFSIGSAQFNPDTATSLPELLKIADITMYGNKLGKLLTIDTSAQHASIG